jgi:cupin 2 domain-containing protein
MAMQHGDLLANIPEALPRELVEVLATSPHVRIERIVSRGHASEPGFWYDQEESEWVLVVSGRARLLCDGEPERTLGPGDWVDLPAHTRHRVTWTDPDQPTIWLGVFYR